jgi:putative heme-binding domain-containing protein
MRRIFLPIAFALLVLPAVDLADEPTIAATEYRSPADELKALRLPPGFEAQLVAAEPEIQKPINLAFDAMGRLWVTCTVEYPFPAAEGKGRDTIKVLSDFGPDGKARHFEAFAAGLNIPIGLLPYKDGAIAYSIPNIWRLRDTDGDGKADKRDVLCAGFGHRDTHGMINGMVQGFDGWVYVNHGFANDSNVRGSDGSTLSMNSGNVFRMWPNGAHVEMVCKGQVNPFGQCVDELGNHYTSDCHSKAITQLLRGAVYSSFAKPHDGLGFGPDLVHSYRGATAICGVCYYGADQFPEYYRSGFFLGEVVNNRVNFFTLARKGGTYTATQQADFITSDDPWFRPVDIKLGPDGAIYIADFYNRIIGHYEVPLTHPGRDRTSGRIWRIVYKGEGSREAKPPEKPIASESIAGLINDLKDSNLAVRMLAMHQLVERGKAAIGPVKTALENSSPTVTAHCLWVLERLKALDDPTLDAAVHPERLIVHVHALKILAERPSITAEQVAFVRDATHDEDGLIRRVAAEALGRHPSADSLKALLDLRERPETANDPFLLHVTRIAIRDNVAAGMKWLVRSDADVDALCDCALGAANAAAAGQIARHLATLDARQHGRMATYVFHVARHGDMATVGPLMINYFRAAADKNPAFGMELLQAVFKADQERGVTPDPQFAQWGLEAAQRLLKSSKADDLQHGVELAGLLRYPPLQTAVLRVMADRRKPERVRLAALAALASFDLAKSVDTLNGRLGDATESAALREKIAQWLAGVNLPQARVSLLGALPTAPARVATAIAAGLAGSADGAAALLDAVAGGKASPRLLQERPVEVKLAALKKDAINQRVKALTIGLPLADARINALLRARAKGYATSKHDAAAGRGVYEKNCASCHQIAGQGAKVGPQLDGIGVRGLDRLLEDVLDPNRNVDQSFRASVVTLKNGQTLTGLVLREEGAVIVLADAQGKEQRIAKADVAEREVSPLSPMPANWSDQIPEKEFFDLIAYLLDQRGK